MNDIAQRARPNDVFYDAIKFLRELREEIADWNESWGKPPFAELEKEMLKTIKSIEKTKRHP